MVEERDVLTLKIFPQLRKMCESRGINWADVDLRWGIPENIAEGGNVLSFCFNEIDRCRPFFIGLLGDRYGWISDSFSDILVESHPWIVEKKGCSNTELEIFYGVLKNPEMADHAYLYIRDPKYIETIAIEKRQDFIEDSIENAKKLQNLKQIIRAAHKKKICNLREGYKNPNQLGEWILEDFRLLINKIFPEEIIPDPRVQESMRHESFAQSRRFAFIGREDLLSNLDEQVSTVSKPIVLLGDSGCGKSALLAEWVARWHISHPDDFIIQHYVGCTPDSADWQGLVRRIIGELKHTFTIPDEVPHQADALPTALNDWIRKVPTPYRVILVLDALNQLAKDDATRQLEWLPEIFPNNFHVLISTLPGEILDFMRKRNWLELEVPLLRQTEIAPAVFTYLGKYSKILQEDILSQLESHYATRNPLYLRVVLEGLRQFGRYEELPARATYYLSAGTLTELYERVLINWEQNYGADMVRESLCFIWASRGGLSEGELLNLLGKGNEPMPRAYWVPFYIAASEALMYDPYGLAFAHSYLSSAVEQRYLKTTEDRTFPHQRLAQYFLSFGLPTLEGNLKALKWLPFHACEANAHDIWIDAMTDFGFLYAVVEHVDVNEGKDAHGNRIPWHTGYFIVLDEIQRWLDRKPTIREVTELVEPLNMVWERHPEFVKSARFVMPTLYHELKTLEKTPPREVLDRNKRCIVLNYGPLWRWCERERQKYEINSKPWVQISLTDSTDRCIAFISYRREGGSETARLIHQELRNRGIRTFLDVEDLSSGHFDERLLREIEAVPNFIVILTPGSLVRCAEVGDWLRREIEHAIRTERNIIPILKDGFDFPPPCELPLTINDLEKNNGVRYDHVLFSATMEKIVSFLKR
jgi:hypothetical protein